MPEKTIQRTEEHKDQEVTLKVLRVYHFVLGVVRVAERMTYFGILVFYGSVGSHFWLVISPFIQ